MSVKRRVRVGVYLFFFLKNAVLWLGLRVTRMITDRIGLYSVLLPLLIRKKRKLNGNNY